MGEVRPYDANIVRFSKIEPPGPHDTVDHSRYFAQMVGKKIE